MQVLESNHLSHINGGAVPINTVINFELRPGQEIIGMHVETTGWNIETQRGFWGTVYKTESPILTFTPIYKPIGADSFY